MKRILRSLGIAVALALAALPKAAAADPSGMPTAAEAPFVTAISADLGTRFATVGAAEHAGYFRYTDEDDTGAISYANLGWTSSDAKHPSQLWYDHAGRLIGADFSVPYAAGAPPHLFGLTPARWIPFHQHVHFGLAGPSGTTSFGSTGPKKIAAVGGDPTKPTAANLVAAGLAKSPGDVKFVFDFPAIWDLPVWLIPNANGAFAEKNPSVKPVNPPKPGMGM